MVNLDLDVLGNRPKYLLTLTYETKTSIHLPVPFTLPLYLLHLLTDILSSRPERLTGPLSLVGPQTTDVVLNLETLISLSFSLCLISQYSCHFEFQLYGIFIFIAPLKSEMAKKMHDLSILKSAVLNPWKLGFFKWSAWWIRLNCFINSSLLKLLCCCYVVIIAYLCLPCYRALQSSLSGNIHYGSMDNLFAAYRRCDAIDQECDIVQGNISF